MQNLTVGEIVGGILAVVALVLLLTLGTGFFNKLEASTEYNTCKASVYKNAYAKLGKFKFLKSIDCETQDVTIKESSEIKIKSRIAKTMLDCWDTFGYGKLDLLDEEEVYCHVCSKIRFKEKTKVKNFMHFLFTAKAKGGRTYATLFSPAMNRNIPITTIPPQVSSLSDIDTTKDYAVTFVYAKGKALDKLVAHYAELGAATAVSGYLLLLGTQMTIWGVAFGGPIGAIPGAAVATAGVITMTWERVFGGQTSDFNAYIQLTEYSSNALKGLQCTNTLS